jgi:hypothetical protein
MLPCGSCAPQSALGVLGISKTPTRTGRDRVGLRVISLTPSERLNPAF